MKNYKNKTIRKINHSTLKAPSMGSISNINDSKTLAIISAATPDFIRLNLSQERLIDGAGSTMPTIKGAGFVSVIIYAGLIAISIGSMLFKKTGSFEIGGIKTAWGDSSATEEKAAEKVRKELGITPSMVKDYKFLSSIYTDG